MIYVFSFIVILIVAVQAATLQKVSLEAYPDAQCNDGSPGVYYIKKATIPQEGIAQWVIMMQGGDWCKDFQNGCASRSKEMTSTTDDGATINQSGIFNEEQMNRVYMRYCSSDGHVGNISLSIAGKEVHFRGHDILVAVFTDLVKYHNLGSLDKKEQIILGGTSAGGRSALFNIDTIAQLDIFPEKIKPGDFVGYFDAPYWLDLSAGTGPLVDSTKGIVEYLKPKHVIPDDCMEQYGTISASVPPWQCLFPEYRLPFVKSHFLMTVHLTDTYLIGNIPTGMSDQTVREETYQHLVEFGKTMETKPNHVAILGVPCKGHGSQSSNRFKDMGTLSGISPYVALQIVTKSVLNTSAYACKTFPFIDSCTTLECSSKCTTGESNNPDFDAIAVGVCGTKRPITTPTTTPSKLATNSTTSLSTDSPTLVNVEPVNSKKSALTVLYSCLIGFSCLGLSFLTVSSFQKVEDSQNHNSKIAQYLSSYPRKKDEWYVKSNDERYVSTLESSPVVGGGKNSDFDLPSEPSQVVGGGKNSDFDLPSEGSQVVDKEDVAVNVHPLDYSQAIQDEDHRAKHIAV